MNYKYTQDGKKVVVIGALNSQESIVQEVYVVDGSDIPAGEHFVAKTLLDAPAVTWKVAEEIRLNSSIAKLKAEEIALLDNLGRFKAYSKAAMDAKLEWIKNIKEPEVAEVMNAVKAILCGEYTHVITEDYHGITIHEWTPELFTTTDYRYYDKIKKFESVRLISLFGHWNDRRPMTWRVNEYSDGSGHNTSFIPCVSLEDALNKARAIINTKDGLSDADYEFLVKHGLPVDPVKNAVRVNRKTVAAMERINTLKAEIEQRQSEIESLNS